MKTLLLTFTFLTSFVFAQTKAIQYKETKRKYIVYTPKGYDVQKSYPVVFNFHGSGMTPAEQMLYTKLNHTADKYGFIIVYPKGIKEDWNVGYGMSYKNGTDDIGFTDALLTQIEKDYNVNSKKVFATGLSRGGFFCHRIAAELSHRFSAVASIGATLPDSVAYYNQNKNEIGVLMVHGKADEIVDYEGKHGGYSSAMNSYDYWKGSLFTDEKSTKINKVKNDHTEVEILESTYGNKSVILISIDNGGHTWPGADDFNIGLPIGLTSKEFDVNEYMWKFFNKQN
ncbi:MULTISPECIES: alpha/beta hydrolase family esterase [Sphingobacterium]|uniref:alpha/beta hydrolase family esterase n=1 Tax=Sphingobacterium TaxID=28453 RepID=UPI0010501C59|nr:MULTISPECIES: alpha/beta hydrolase-fold protein [Sphingobacterium]MCW2259689.1 polyhydroxybutyrate depolymerase [Sphingobacterium kitahiroshimense]TCR03469.1 polyhydroxybutyrate depolymerase [Sphingobacterium sp. JUb78]